MECAGHADGGSGGAQAAGKAAAVPDAKAAAPAAAVAEKPKKAAKEGGGAEKTKLKFKLKVGGVSDVHPSVSFLSCTAPAQWPPSGLLALPNLHIY